MQRQVIAEFRDDDMRQHCRPADFFDGGDGMGA
jgi:hypothetical protein